MPCGQNDRCSCGSVLREQIVLLEGTGKLRIHEKARKYANKSASDLVEFVDDSSGYSFSPSPCIACTFVLHHPTPSRSFGITAPFSSKLKSSHHYSDLVCVYHILSALFTLAGCYCLALTLKTVPHKSPAPSRLKALSLTSNPLTRFLDRFRIAGSFPVCYTPPSFHRQFGHCREMPPM